MLSSHMTAFLPFFASFFFFNDTATTEIYTLSLHDALPILERGLEVVVVEAHAEGLQVAVLLGAQLGDREAPDRGEVLAVRSEEHTSELQSRFDLVCRLLLEKKKKKTT